MTPIPAFDLDEYRRERNRQLERRVEFLEAERRRLEWLLGQALRVAVADTPTTPTALLALLCEIRPTNPARAAVFEDRRS